MAMLNPYQQYAQNQVTTATPEELTLLLYKGAVKFIGLAIKGIENNDIQLTHTNIVKAQDIYRELLATLDPKYDLSKNLSSLYDYVLDLLVQANIKKDKQLLEQALGISKEFAETWQEAIKIYRRIQTAPKNIGEPV